LQLLKKVQLNRIDWAERIMLGVIASALVYLIMRLAA
jgi:hypothetical protein